jgi:hypothetical protein
MGIHTNFDGLRLHLLALAHDVRKGALHQWQKSITMSADLICAVHVLALESTLDTQHLYTRTFLLDRKVLLAGHVGMCRVGSRAEIERRIDLANRRGEQWYATYGGFVEC